MPFRVLYYPSWNPPVKWLRSMLLFFDQVQVIYPEDVPDPGYREANKAVFELIPDAFYELRKRHYEMTLLPRNKRIIASALDFITQRLPPQRDREFAVEISSDGSGAAVPGYAFLHSSKLNPWVLDQLQRRSLILRPAEDILRNMSNIEGFRIVERGACNLVLALIADYYGRQNGLRTITDHDLSYFTNVLNVEPLRRGEAATNLASTVIRVAIPDKIETMKAKDYVALRNRYEDMREPFQRAIGQLCDDNLLAEIRNKKAFDDTVFEIARDFCAETERLRKTLWGRRVTNWVTVGLGVLSSYCSLAGGTIAALGTGISVVLHVFRGLGRTDCITEKRRAQQLLGELKDELAHPFLLRRLTRD